ncbi:carbohydrate ABC transporter permease [Bifidobacterium psychraerophilum]|uniref:carbohydrate ABC transporter permease n=1 Tax=Bifidobacterium psychraerophilum TaxID=218140 RepID=UPI0039EB4DB4
MSIARIFGGPGTASSAADEYHRHKRLSVHGAIRWVIIAILVIIQVYPLLWLFITSLRTEHDFASGDPFGIPKQFTLENYARAFEAGDLGVYIRNSLIVTFGASFFIVLMGMMAAYAINVLGFRGSKIVSGIFLLGIIVPVQIALVPLFIDYSQINLLDTYASMIIPLAGFAVPMSVFLFSSFYNYIPKETYEAASLDGAGPYRIFWQITLPLSLNTIVTVVLVNSIFIWNEFIFANTFVLSDGLKTIPLGLQNYIGAMGNTDWTATFAAVCVTITPLMLIFMVLNKAMIQGLEGGATKG